MPGGSLRGFAEKVALVACGTPGAHRLGRAVAIQLALEGAYVIVSHAPDDMSARLTINELREMGTLAHAIEADARNPTDIKRSFEQVNQIYGRLDMLAHIVAVETDERITTASADAVGELLNTGLRATVLQMRHANEMFMRRGTGAIVNVIAASVRDALELNDTDNALRLMVTSGIVELTRAAARELAPRVRVNCVAQGKATNIIKRETGGASVENLRDFARAFEADKGLEAFLNRTTSATDEVGRAALYLLSPEARFVTGQMLTVGE